MATGAVLSSQPVSGEEALFGGLAMDAAGELWSIDGYNDGLDDRTFRIDPATAAGVVVGDTGENWNFRSVTYDLTTDTLWASRDNAIYTIDRASGAATLAASVSGTNLDQLTSMAIAPTGEA